MLIQILKFVSKFNWPTSVPVSQFEIIKCK